MTDFLFYALFLAVALSLALEPGPGFVKLAIETAAKGGASAVAAAAGMAAGAVPHVLLVSFGLDALADAMPDALSVARLIGGLYLVWLAVSLLRQGAGRGDLAAAPAGAGGPGSSRVRSLVGGVALVLLNPRTPVLYAAFLPLFVREQSAMAVQTQLMGLGLAVVGVFLLVDLAFVAVLRRAGPCLRAKAGLARLMRYAGASAFALFGLRLLFRDD